MAVSRYMLDHRLECRKSRRWSSVCIFGNMGAFKTDESCLGPDRVSFWQRLGQKEQRSSEVKGASVIEARLIGLGMVG